MSAVTILQERVGRDPHRDENEASYAPGQCGAQTIAHAVKDALATGKPQRLLIRQHPTKGDRRDAILAFGVGEVDGKQCLRWCGANDDPMGECSSSVIASWYPDECMDAAALAGVVCYHVGQLCARHDAWVYRQ